jgi:hypothetical protein
MLDGRRPTLWLSIYPYQITKIRYTHPGETHPQPLENQWFMHYYDARTPGWRTRAA